MAITVIEKNSLLALNQNPPPPPSTPPLFPPFSSNVPCTHVQSGILHLCPSLTLGGGGGGGGGSCDLTSYRLSGSPPPGAASQDQQVSEQHGRGLCVCVCVWVGGGGGGGLGGACARRSARREREKKAAGKLLPFMIDKERKSAKNALWNFELKKTTCTQQKSHVIAYFHAFGSSLAMSFGGSSFPVCVCGGGGGRGGDDFEQFGVLRGIKSL